MTKATAQKTTSKKSVVQSSKPVSKKATPDSQENPVAVKQAVAKKAAGRPASQPSEVTPTPAGLGAGATSAKESPKTKASPLKTTEKPQSTPIQHAPEPTSSASTAATSNSRFADRFAPPRPPTRQMSNLSNDLPRPAQVADPKLANAWKTKAGRDMTDEEILAMPDSEYMNDKQLDFFRARLQAQKDNLLSNAGETTEHLREDTSIVPDPADRATIEEEHALELRTRDRERKLLKKISQSLLRIENGEYGFCDETGEPIGLGRLIARPTATLSLEAQQRRELKQKMFGD